MRVSAVNTPNYEPKTHLRLRLTFTSYGLVRCTPSKRMAVHIVVTFESRSGFRGAKKGGRVNGRKDGRMNMVVARGAGHLI